MRGARLRELLGCHEYPSSTKIAFLTGYVDIALEHHEAISLLVNSKLYGSAFTLVRPLFETVFRALWINQAADEAQIEKASRDKFESSLAVGVRCGWSARVNG
jgi:hypothetical protein